MVHKWLAFRPALLAGANWRERVIAAAGALIGIAVTSLIGGWLGASAHIGVLLVASMGASAVLVFVVPSSPLAQPWPVAGGHLVSALTGVAVTRLLGTGPLAAGTAVAAAILAMSLLRCLHPPGGGTALLPLVGGPAVAAQGFGFAFLPVEFNALALLAVGFVFHRFSGHSYPHRALPLPDHPRLAPQDIDAALAETGETFDISHEDLEALLERAERHARARRIRR